jgi:hypothetical protein
LLALLGVHHFLHVSRIRVKGDMIIKVYWFSCKVPLFLSDVNETCMLSTDFRKTLKYEILENPGDELFHAEGRKDGQT